MPGQLVEYGPVLENRMTGTEVDLTRFPAPLWHTHDGGRYIGVGDIVVTRDPDSGWVNCGTYRVQVHDANTAGIMISPGKHGRIIREAYWSRGEACPVAVSLGHDPLLLLMGGIEIDYGVNEYDIAGGIRGEPVQLINAPHTGLPVPATSEIIIEGEIPPNEVHPEGPFGEWTGYYAGGERDMPITPRPLDSYRNNPIVLGCLPGKPPNDNTYFRSPLRAAMIGMNWSAQASPASPACGPTRQRRAPIQRGVDQADVPGHSKQVGMAAASCPAGAYANRMVIVVDDDIDPTDTNEVLWALNTRADMIDDVDVMKRCRSTSLDPMAYGDGEGGRYYNNRMIIDACRPYERLKSFPAVARKSQEEAQELRERWPSCLLRRQGAARCDSRLRVGDPLGNPYALKDAGVSVGLCLMLAFGCTSSRSRDNRNNRPCRLFSNRWWALTRCWCKPYPTRRHKAC